MTFILAASLTRNLSRCAGAHGVEINLPAAPILHSTSVPNASLLHTLTSLQVCHPGLQVCILTKTKSYVSCFNAAWNVINLRSDPYLSFDHVQHTAQLLQLLLQLFQPVVCLYLRDTFHSLRRSGRPQRCCSQLLITLDVFGTMVCLKFTERCIVMKPSAGVSWRAWTVEMRPRKVIWRRRREIFILFSRNNLILNKHPGDQCLNEGPHGEITNTVRTEEFLCFGPKVLLLSFNSLNYHILYRQS